MLSLTGEYGALVDCHKIGDIRAVLSLLSEQLEEVESMAYVASNSLAAERIGESEQKVMYMAFCCAFNLRKQVEVLNEKLHPEDSAVKLVKQAERQCVGGACHG